VSPVGAPGARVAVVIPCFNDGQLAREAVASVQEPEPVEIVVVDDASTDPATPPALAELAAGGRVRLVSHPENRGLSQARMTGVHATAAPYVFPLDADDQAVAGALSRMADLLDGHPEAAVCFGDYIEFGDHQLVRGVPDRLDPFRVAYINEYPPSALFRRDALEAVGGWSLEGPPAGYEDWDVWMALAERGASAVHAGPELMIYRRRLHGTRMLTGSKRNHVTLYRRLRSRHRDLFARIADHRRASDMPWWRKRLYPIVYGRRPRFAWERHVKAALDRHGIWTLRR
jgi:glycosyltransferase involved in cell wall biosynthesis